MRANTVMPFVLISASSRSIVSFAAKLLGRLVNPSAAIACAPDDPGPIQMGGGSSILNVRVYGRGVVMWDWFATLLDLMPGEYRGQAVPGVLAVIAVVGAILGGMIRGRFDRRKLQRMTGELE